MAFNFPDTPTEGQVFTPAGGPSYQYKNGLWRQAASSWITATARPRNAIVNPGFQLSQENGQAAGNTSGYYIADQWHISNAGVAVVNSRQNVNTAGIVSYPTMGLMNVGTANAAPGVTDHFTVQTFLEGVRCRDWGWGGADAWAAVFRCAFLSTMSPATFAISLRSLNAPTQSLVLPLSVPSGMANKWIEYEWPIPGVITGTWPNDGTKFLVASLFLMAGTNFIAPAGAVGQWTAAQYYGVPGMSNGLSSVGQQYLLTNVGFYADPENTQRAPAFELPNHADDIRECRRYWQQTQIRFHANVTSGQAYYANAFLDEIPRSGPALTGVNAGASSFPATVGPLSVQQGNSVVENRTANATGTGFYATTLTVNARP